MKKAYYYLFYRFYKFADAAPSRWLSEWKASFSMDIMVFFLIMSILNYYTTIFNRDINFENRFFFVLGFIFFICIPNYIIFNHKDKWKDIVKSFDKLPKRENRTLGIITWIIILITILNLVFSYYCIDRRAMKNHTGPYSTEYLNQNR